ncbi:MAG: hypothetical protein K2N98_00765 [Lachnospiraceae bacterium]|nr:hypothetical protein [Lachnospiraceae bacterium]
MKQININGTNYVAVNINTDILLTEKNIETLYHNFFLSKENGTFDGSFTEYCEFCFLTAAGFYFLDASRLKARDRDASAVLLYDERDSIKEMKGVF